MHEFDRRCWERGLSIRQLREVTEPDGTVLTFYSIHGKQVILETLPDTGWNVYVPIKQRLVDHAIDEVLDHIEDDADA
jgi:hypothetical protein